MVAFPITFKYKNRDKYQTVFGGVASMISFVIILSYISIEITSFLNKSQYQIYENTRNFRNESEDPIKLNINNFDFAALLLNPDNEISLNMDQYLQISFVPFKDTISLIRKQSVEEIIQTNKD